MISLALIVLLSVILLMFFIAWRKSLSPYMRGWIFMFLTVCFFVLIERPAEFQKLFFQDVNSTFLLFPLVFALGISSLMIKCLTCGLSVYTIGIGKKTVTENGRYCFRWHIYVPYVAKTCSKCGASRKRP